MPRSLSVNRVKRKSKHKSASKKRASSVNIERLREDKKKKNASNKIKRFIKRVNNKHKGKMALSRRSFNRLYAEQEQRRRNLYRNRIVPIVANTRPMSEEEIQEHLNMDEMPTSNMIPYNSNAFPLLVARPENKRKTVKSYRSVAMLVPPDEAFFQQKIDHNIRLIHIYKRDLFKLYDASEQTTNAELKEQIEVEILEIKEEIEKLNREIERLEHPEPRQITTEKPVYVPEARCMGSECVRAEEERDENRLAVNFMGAIDNNTVNRYEKNGALSHAANYRAAHIEIRRQKILRRINRILQGRTIEELTPEDRQLIEQLRQLL
jgi:hypothetical protein